MSFSGALCGPSGVCGIFRPGLRDFPENGTIGIGMIFQMRGAGMIRLIPNNSGAAKNMAKRLIMVDTLLIRRSESGRFCCVFSMSLNITIHIFLSPYDVADGISICFRLPSIG